MEDILFDLYYSSVHRNEELEDTIEDKEKTIHELQSVLKFRTNENKELYKENNRLKEVIKIKDDARIELVEENKKLKKCLTIADNDLQQATNEVSILNRQLDRQNNAVNDLSDIVDTSHKVIDDLKTENKELKFKLKMLTKVYMNSIYGITATDYTDTDSIKETTENDSDN